MNKQLFFYLAILIPGFFIAQDVNEFTGAFSYNLPLVHLPSNRGPGVPIGISYHGGIKTEQASSEIGLGWSINSECAVYRTAVGFPDDMHSFVSSPSYGNQIRAQGALYPVYNSALSTTNYDIGATRRGMDANEFNYPDFDIYDVSGPGYGGQMQLSYHQFHKYFNTSHGASNGPPYSYCPLTANCRAPQFHFVNDFSDTLISKHYPNTVTSISQFKDPTDGIAVPAYTDGTESFIGKHLNGTTISNENYDVTTGRLATKNFVEYFTNHDIDQANANNFPQNTPLANFIDYKNTHSRSGLPAEGIGYFRITGANGLTYHYSLPVYALENINYSIPLKHDYSPYSSLHETDFTNSGEDYFPGNINIQIKSKTQNKYALKWLLTAVTGPDFEDSNNNHIVDSTDLGYWIRYDYSLWNSGLIERTPRYGYNYQFSPDEATREYPQYFPVVPAGSGYAYKLSGLYGSVSVNKSEEYYLNRIRSSSHTVIFVRDIRNDEKGGDEAITAGLSFKPTPQLSLKRIILLKNEQLDSLTSLHPPVSFVTSSYGDFDFPSSVNYSNSGIYNESWFQTNFGPGAYCILKHVAFEQDYSLCRKYHGNINVNCYGSTVLSSRNEVKSYLTNTNYNASGKLTLLRVLTYELGNIKVKPSVVFDYQSTASFGNPDYDPIKTDYWGYFKYDATNKGYSGYTNVLSKNYTKAWSMDKITDPLGAVTEIQYESNSYNKVIDNDCINGVRGAAFIYRIKDVDIDPVSPTGAEISQYFKVVMEEGDDPNYSLSEFQSLSTSAVTGIKRKICIPFYESVNDCPTCTDYAHQGILLRGFVSGDCSYAITGNASGSTEHVTGAITSAPKCVYNLDGDRYYFANYSTLWATTGAPTAGGSGGEIVYSGNGFLMIETPIGYNVYGGGVRVRQIRTKNKATEVYTREYSYEDGVATNEMDRFDYQVQKKHCIDEQIWHSHTDPTAYRFDYLQPKGQTRFNLGAGIGYSKVSVKDLGQINTPNGKVETVFLTDPSAENSLFNKNYAITTTIGSYQNGSAFTYSVINECVNNFSNIFGKVKENRVFDKNNILLSRTVYEYEPTQQGALTEHFFFQNQFLANDIPHYALSLSSAVSKTVNILRQENIHTKSVTTYGMGTYSKSEMLAADEITGEDVCIRTTGINNSSSLSYKIPAYKYYYPANGLNINSASSRAVFTLGNNLFSYSTIDSTLSSPVAGSTGYSGSFLSAGYLLYTNTMRQKQINPGTGLYSIVNTTLPYFVNNRSFSFNGGPGSMNEFGLLDKTLLDANPLNLSASPVLLEPGSTQYNWKLMSEVTLLDEYKNIIETRDANDRFSASRYDNKGYYKSSSVTNCNYSSYSYAGFEDKLTGSGAFNIDGDITGNTGNHNFITSSSIMNAHTGSQFIQVGSTPLVFKTKSELSPGGSLQIGLLPGRIYRASVWANSNNLSNAVMAITVNGAVNSVPHYTAFTANAANNLVTTIGNWNLIQIDFEIPEGFSTGTSGELSIELKSNSSSVYFDDFILHPVESNFEASIYNIRTGRLMSTLDGNGLATNFFYNAAGEMLELWKEIPSVGLKKIKKFTYNYARGANN